MSTYYQIAQDTINVNREDGSTRAVKLTFMRNTGSAQTYGVPLIHDIIHKQGDQGDARNKPIKVSTCSVAFKGVDEPLIEAIQQATAREMMLRVEVGAAIVFEGFLLPDFLKYDLYEDVQGVTARFYGGLADLGDIDLPDSDVRTIKEFADQIGTALDLPRELDVYSSLAHVGRSTSDPLPNEMRFASYDSLGRFSPEKKGATMLGELKSLLYATGWQAFQHQGRLVFADVYDRIASPDAVNAHLADGQDGFTHSSKDFRYNVIPAKAIRGGKVENKRPVKTLLMQRMLRKRDTASFDSPTSGSSTVLVSKGNSKSYSMKRGLAIAGDKLQPRITGVVKSFGNPSAIVAGDVHFAQIILHDQVKGDDYYYNRQTDAWVKGIVQQWTREFTFLPGDGQQQTGFSESLNTAPVPDDVVAEIEIIVQNDLSITQGSASDVGDCLFTEIGMNIIQNDRQNKVTQQFTAEGSFSVGDQLVSSTYIGDTSLQTIRQNFEYLDGSVWKKTHDWVDESPLEAPDTPLAKLVAKRLGSVLTGGERRVKVTLRDLDAISLLSVFPVQENDETVTNYIPLEITHSLLAGYYDLVLEKAVVSSPDMSNSYALGVDESAYNEDSGTGGSSNGGGGSPGEASGGGVSDHGLLSGLLDDDHPQYLNDARGDARYIRPDTTPSLDQVVLNNPASADNQALRAGQVLQTSAPLSGGGKLRSGLDVKLDYNSTDFKVQNGKLRTAQRVDEGADMVLASLTTKTGGVKSDDYSAGLNGTGYGISQTGEASLKSLSVRETLLVRELEVRKLRYSKGPHIFGPGGGKIAQVVHNSGSSYTLTFPEEPGVTSDDFLLIQEFNPNTTAVVRQSRLDVTATNGKSIDVTLLSGSAPQVGDSAAVVASGNSSRDSLVYIDPFGPNIDLLDGITNFTKWDARSPKIRIGLLDGMPAVGGVTPSGYSLYGENVYLKDGHFEGSITVTGGNASTKAYASGQASSAENAAKSYADGKVYRYSRDTYDASDAYTSYSPQPDHGIMIKRYASGWPSGYGQVHTYAGYGGGAKQIYYELGSTNKTYERYWYASGGYWTSFRQTEDITGSQSKADAAEQGAKGYTDILQTKLDNILDDAVTQGTTLITGGFLKNQFINTSAIVVGDLGDGSDYATKSYAAGQASSAETSAKGYTDSLEAAVQGKIGEAMNTGKTIIVGGYVNTTLIKTSAIVVGDLGDGSDYSTKAYASGQASSAENAAKSYADGKVYRYSRDTYDASDAYTSYSPQPDHGIMIKKYASGWPSGYGQVHTYAGYAGGAKQIYYELGSTNKTYERYWYAYGGYWTSFRQTEDITGSQAKADAAEQGAKGYTDTLQNAIEGKIGEAINTGKTIIVNGYINTNVVDMDLLLAQDAVISGTLVSSNWSSSSKKGFRITAQQGKIEAYDIDIADTIRATSSRTHITGDLYMDEADGSNPGNLILPKNVTSGNRGRIDGEGIGLPYDQAFKITVSPTTGLDDLYRVKAHENDGYTEIFSDPGWGVQENHRKFFSPSTATVSGGSAGSLPAPDGQLLVVSFNGSGMYKVDRINPQDDQKWEKIIIFNASYNNTIRLQRLSNTVTTLTGNIYMRAPDSDIFPRGWAVLLRDDHPKATAKYSLQAGDEV